MLAQHPQIAAAGHRLLERLGNGILIGETLPDCRRLGQQRFHLLVGEPQHVQVELILAQLCEQPAQQLFIQAGVQSQLVVGDDQGSALGLREVIEHDHRHFRKTQLPRRLKPRVASDNARVFVYQNWGGPPKFQNAGRNLSNLFL